MTDDVATVPPTALVPLVLGPMTRVTRNATDVQIAAGRSTRSLASFGFTANPIGRGGASIDEARLLAAARARAAGSVPAVDRVTPSVGRVLEQLPLLPA